MTVFFGTYLNRAMRRLTPRTKAIRRKGNINRGAIQEPYVQTESISPFSYISIRTGSVQAEKQRKWLRIQRDVTGLLT